MKEKILIVDDAMFMRRVIRKGLEEHGYTDILEAADGEQALTMYDSFSPALVLLDITMPGKSGLEVLEELEIRHPEAKVIMCSAVGQEAMIRKAIELGARDFIVKPFKMEKLIRVVSFYLEQ